jgi:hypothetical protein
VNNFSAGITMTRLSKLICTVSFLGLATPTVAEVQSLSSSELTETYIRDSTIIVTPKQQQAQSEKKTYSSLTIAPVENSEQDIDKLNHLQNHVSSTSSSYILNDELLRSASIDSALAPALAASIPTYEERFTRPIEEVMNDARYAVPDGNFDFTYIGGDGSKDLGLSRTDNQLTFSIGNLPEIDQINLPQGINEGPLQITPRVGGGFDLTINIPENN